MISFFSGGDFRHFYSENISDFITFPLAWDSSLNTGIGHSQNVSLWIVSYFNFTILFNKLWISWNLISLLFWILPSIIVSFLSAFFLFSNLFKNKIKYSLLSGIVYTFNTYFLIILTGGQLGVALSYSLAPLVILIFIRITKNPTLRNSVVSGLILGLQILFDPRIAYITLVAVLLYLSINLSRLKAIGNKAYLLLPFLLAFLLNMFWILPLFIDKNVSIPEGFSSTKGFEFFSFADFSHALSFLHPNWPENIFGKTYFMKPEFLLFPILAFSSLLFISKIKYQKLKTQIKNQKYDNNLAIEQFSNRTILFFALLGLTGTFLAKGANEPFGAVNIWMFENVPGFVMFRDPTKFYVLTALAYSVLIPFSVYSIYNRLNSRFKIQNYLSNLFLVFTFLYFTFIVHPIFLGTIFKTREVPEEYIQLKDFLYNKPEFFRTLWIPQWQRLGYFSNNHPAIGREEIFKGNAKEQIDQVKKPNTERILRDLSVKYIIVPYDSEGEIFLKDRKYDERQYKQTIENMRKIRWLKEVDFGKIAMFEVDNPKDHFWSPSAGIKINYNFLSPTEYDVEVQNARKGDLLVFSEGFDKNWRGETTGIKYKVLSRNYENLLNSFVSPKDGNYILKVYYDPQKWVNIGLGVSGITILAIFIVLGLGKVRSK